MDDATDDDQRLPHHRLPDEPVPLANLLGMYTLSAHICILEHAKKSLGPSQKNK
jgi:hypothetical protein